LVGVIIPPPLVGQNSALLSDSTLTDFLPKL
jgi:hypothetical protein